MFGSHLSIAGGLVNALEAAERLRMDCVQVFTKNQRQWRVGPLSPDDESAWHAKLKSMGWHRRSGPVRVVSHNSYLINMASPDPEAWEKSVRLQRIEIERCETLGIRLCVAHPGAHLGAPRRPGDPNDLEAAPSRDEVAGLKRIARALDRIHRELPGYRTLTCIETTVGSGTNLGYAFEHLAFLRENVREPERVGFCFDSCHVTAAGYDMTTDGGAASVLRRFNAVCGSRHLRVFHLNDSVGAVGSRRDRHAHIGHGACGISCFRAIVNRRSFERVPKILETPKEDTDRGQPWDIRNIRRLKRLIQRLCAADREVVSTRTEERPSDRCGRVRGCGEPWAVLRDHETGQFMRFRRTNLALLALLLASGLAGCEIFKGFTEGPGGREMEAGRPSDEEAELLASARAASAAGDYDDALSIFQEILANNPTIATAYLGIGEIYMIKKDYDKAEPAFGRAARLEPRSFDAQYGHGLALQMLDRFVDATRAYHRALTIDPNSGKANLNLATTYLQLREPNRAVVFAEKAIEVDPENGAAHANLGAIYEELARYAEAIDTYIAAIELMGNRPPLMLNLINVLGKERRYREAANTAATLVRIAPTAPAYERLGWCHFKLREYDASLQAYRDAVEIDPDYWPALNGIGVNALNRWLLSKKRDNDARIEAHDAFRRSLRADSDQPKVVSLMLNYNL